MDLKTEQRLNAVSGTLDTIAGRLPEPNSLRDIAAFMLVSEVVTLGDVAAGVLAIQAAFERKAAGVDMALARSIERMEKGKAPFDAERFSSNDATRLQANIRLAGFLRSAVAERLKQDLLRVD